MRNNDRDSHRFLFYRNRHSTTAASWSGRVTIPEPFALTNSMNMDSVHRRKCIPEFEASKLQKTVDEEISLAHRPFKGNESFLSFSSFNDSFFSKTCSSTCSNTFV